MVFLNSKCNDSLSSLEDATAFSSRKPLGLNVGGLLKLRISNKNETIDGESESCCSVRRESCDECASGKECSSKRSLFARRHRKRPLGRHDPALSLPPEVCTSKHVSFAEQEAIVVTTVSFPEDCKGDLFYSKKELGRMSSRAQRIGEDISWGKDKHIVNCLQYCYGFSTQQHDLTQDRALKHFFYYEVAGGKSGTTLRGLERHILPRIIDHRQQCVQSVLALQAKLRRKGEASSQDLEKALAEQSRQQSEKARKFARILGMGDAVVCAEIAA